MRAHLHECYIGDTMHAVCYCECGAERYRGSEEWREPPVVNDEPYCLDCGGRPGDHLPECTKGDLAIKVATKREPCVCGHDRVEHHPCGPCEHDCACLNYRAASSAGVVG